MKDGITLIALIITIIILVILAAVSINAAYNSGIINYAVNGTQEYVEGAKEEERRLASAEGVLDSVMARLEGLQGQGGSSSGVANLPSVAAGAKASTNSKYTSGTGANAKTAVIPEGFTVSGISGEQNIDTGLVIYDIPAANLASINWSADSDDNDYLDVQENYNQFVWVPVATAYIEAGTLADIIEEQNFEDEGDYTAEAQALNYWISENGTYPMAVKINNTDYRGVLYDFNAMWDYDANNGDGGYVWSDNIQVINFSSTDNYQNVEYYREPAYLPDDDYGDASSYNTIGLTQAKLQQEYNAMVESVSANGGFWVARYEITEDASARITRGKTVATSDSSSLNMWYGLYYACRDMYNSTSNAAQSIMISGSQYDQIMLWMKNIMNGSNRFILDSTGKGVYDAESYEVSGSNDNYAANKIFDLAGNLWEWTSEAYYTDYRVHRGGFCIYDGSRYPAAYRYYDVLPYNAYNGYSSRPTLFVKSAKTDALTALTEPISDDDDSNSGS